MIFPKKYFAYEAHLKWKLVLYHFNLMFKTHVGALEDSSSVTYLRPETCQGIFANFDNVVSTSRVKVPFGIAQKSSRARK